MWIKNEFDKYYYCLYELKLKLKLHGISFIYSPGVFHLLLLQNHFNVVIFQVFKINNEFYNV